jgi:HEAT repeat protein
LAIGVVAGGQGASAQSARVARARTIASHAAGELAIQKGDPADSLYRLARKAINDRDYRRAASLFKQIVDKYPSSDRAGDALYWRAWSLYHAGADARTKSDLDEALASLDQYSRTYGKNGQLASDAADLRGQIRAAQASLGDAAAAGDLAQAATRLRQQPSCSGSSADQEMRMAALEGLLTMNSEDAVPILKDVLKQRDRCRDELRKKAVWLISQKRAGDIVPTLLDVARNDPSTDVRGDAIFWLSQTRSEAVIPALDSVLFAGGDEEIRKKAIFSLSQFRDERARQSLRRAAEDGRLSEEIRGDAIFWLGNSHSNADLDYFKTLFKKTTNEELRSKIVQAVSQTGTPEATNWLLDVARDKSFDVETRKNALFWASQRRLLDLDQVMQIYNQARGDDAMQEQVIFVLSQRREPAAVDRLMDIAKGDSNIEMKKKAVFWLSQKNDPRVRQFLLDLIKK